jgi:hypothetical protein
MNGQAWVKLGVGIAIAVALYFVGLFIYNAGEANVQAKWDRDTIQKQEQYEKDLTAAVASVRQEEQLKALALVNTTRALLEAKNARQKQVDSVLSSMGSSGLWIDVQCSTPEYNLGKLAASPCRSDGTARLRLSDESAKFLVTRAKLADDYTDQLRAAQNILAIDRQTVDSGVLKAANNEAP